MSGAGGDFKRKEREDKYSAKDAKTGRLHSALFAIHFALFVVKNYFAASNSFRREFGT